MFPRSTVVVSSLALVVLTGCAVGKADETGSATSSLVGGADAGAGIPLDRIQIDMAGDPEIAIPPSAYRDDCVEMYDLKGVNHLDQPLRMFRDTQDTLHVVASNNLNLQFTASDFADVGFRDLQQQCKPVIDNHKDLHTTEEPKPARFMSREWLLSTFATEDGKVYGYVHNELHGEIYDPLRPECNDPGATCWYASITKYLSTDGGLHFDPLTLPEDRTHLLMASVDRFHPFTYDPDGTRHPTGKAGIAGHSNVLTGTDGAHYMFVNRIELTKDVQKPGVCLLRSTGLKRWSSWRGPTEGFVDNLADPYSSTSDLESRSCEVLTNPEGPVPRFYSVTYHPALQTFISIVPVSSDTGEPGFGYALSRDMLRWTTPRFLRKQLSQDAGVLIDHHSPSRNFDVTGDHPYLYFGAFCGQGPGTAAHCVKRERMRISIR